MTNRIEKNFDFFIAGGTLPPDAPCYVKRLADDELLDLVLSGTFCYVLTPRQMGKSSLMSWTAKRLKAQSVSTVIIDLTQIGTVSVDQWYLGLLTQLRRRLRLKKNPIPWWQARASLSPVQRFTDFLCDVVLKEVNGQVVIFIDEIDTTLNLDFSDDFFAAIRAIYNARAQEPEFKRLTFILLGVATPLDLIKDPLRTPFNIGQDITLTDFSRSEAILLQKGLEAIYPSQGEAIFERIYDWTDGHPYLTQKLCFTIARSDEKHWSNEQIDSLVEELFFSETFGKEPNLQFVQDRVLNNSERRRLLKLYQKVYEDEQIKDDRQSITQNQLKLSGLVKVENGYLQTRNPIYHRVFDLDWAKRNSKINWQWKWIWTIVIFVVLLLGASLTIYNSWL